MAQPPEQVLSLYLRKGVAAHKLHTGSLCPFPEDVHLTLFLVNLRLLVSMLQILRTHVCREDLARGFLLCRFTYIRPSP